MNYFVSYRFDNTDDFDYYDSFIYEGKIENQNDFNKLKNFIKTKRKRKGRLFIIKVEPLERCQRE